MGASLLAVAKSIYYIYIYLSGFDKMYPQKFQVRFNNKKQLKVAS